MGLGHKCYYCSLSVDPKEDFEIKVGTSETYYVHQQCLENYEKDKAQFDKLLKDNPKEFSEKLRMMALESYEDLMLGKN